MNSDPTRGADEDTWRNRFILMNLVRIGGTVVVLIGLAIWHSDWVRQGGAMEIGLPLALLGLVVSFGGPKWLSRKWQASRRR
jgi:hypothetical protein